MASNALSSPSTPSSIRIRDISNQLLTPSRTPKRLRNTPTKSSGSPTKRVKLGENTPPSSPVKKGIFNPFEESTSIYSRAKSLFQRGSNVSCSQETSQLVGRQTEAEYLNNFFIENVKNHTSNSLYISGPPGTGKTAQIGISFEHFKKVTSQKSFIKSPLDNNNVMINNSQVKLVKINCMAVNSPENIFHEVYSQIVGRLSISYNKKKTSEDLLNLLKGEGELSSDQIHSAVVVLDEMDCLITRDQQVLFELFNFASAKYSHHLQIKLILIGISNALDLTDKFLPRLKRNGLNPQALQFLPYTCDQIKAVIVSKLRSLNESDEDKENLVKESLVSQPSLVPLFHPAAILLCCKKSASITGDLRKAFDLCYKSIEMVEATIKDTSDLTNNNCPQVTISHVARVCSSSFGDNSLTKLTNLNLLQKAVLCCLFHHQIYQAKDLNVNAFYDFYVKHCTENIDRLLGIVKKGEFLEIISALESASVISLSDKKILKANNLASVDIGNKSIKSNVPYDDLVKCIGDVGVLRRIIRK